MEGSEGRFGHFMKWIKVDWMLVCLFVAISDFFAFLLDKCAEKCLADYYKTDEDLAKINKFHWN